MAVQDITKNEAVMHMRSEIARIGKFLFDRQLTDAAGGNISARVGDVICMSPSYSGSKRQWQLEPDDVLVVDFERNILAGEGSLSRETNVHLKLHSDFGDYGTAVIHAHARNLLVFATVARPMPPVLEATRKFGVTPVIEYAPAHSPKLAENVAATMIGREDRIKKHAAGTIAPWHGLFLMGKDLDAAFDAVERFDTNAYCIIMGQMLLANHSIEQPREMMEDVIPNYTED